MAVVSVTRLRLRSVRFLPSFIWYTRRSAKQAQKTPGNLGVRIRKTKGLAFWTLAMWRDDQAIRAFVPASPHREAMRKLPHWCDEAAFTDWEQDTTDWVLGNRKRKTGQHGSLGQRALSVGETEGGQD